MHIWNVHYRDSMNNISVNFKVRATDKAKAIDTATSKMLKMFPYSEYRFLNNYNFTFIK